MATSDPKNSLTQRNLKREAKREAEREAERQRQRCTELWEKYVLEMSLAGELSVCQGGLGFVCSEPAVIGGLCWPHFSDDLGRPMTTNLGSDPTTPTITAATNPTAAPRLAPVPRHETCNLQDLVLNNNTLADDGDAMSQYDEAGAPTTEGGDVEGQYESAEVDDAAAAFDFLEGDDPVLLLAASIRPPHAEEDDDLEEVDEPAGQPAAPQDTGSTFQLPGVNWSWPSEASVASLVKGKPKTHVLLRIFPAAQGYKELASGRFKCTSRARVGPDTGRWEAHDCSQTFKRQYEWRRHFLTIHLAGSRWEDVAKQRKIHGEDSTTTEPKKPRAKRVPRQALPSASTSASASTSTATPPPEVQLQKPRQKRKRQGTEDKYPEDEGYEDWGQSGSDRKGKKARRW